MTALPANATGHLTRIVSDNAEPNKSDYVRRAIEHVQNIKNVMGLQPNQPAEFQVDPNYQTSSSGAVAVHLQQQYKGLPIFQATETVRFGVDGAIREATGNAVAIGDDKSMSPSISPSDAVLRAARHVCEPSADEASAKDQFGERLPVATIDVSDFEPQIAAAYPESLNQTVLFEGGPFGDKIKTGLIWFHTGSELRLAWEVLITMPKFFGQYRTLENQSIIVQSTSCGNERNSSGCYLRQRRY